MSKARKAPQVVGVDPDELPFQEWSDQDVKAEKFDFSSVKDKKLGGSSVPLLERFVDAHDVKLPRNFAAKEWKKPQDIFPKAHFAVFVNRASFPDLVAQNAHISSSEFVKNFICAVSSLLYLGNVGVFPVEYTSNSCSPPEKSWRPWHHIYSNSNIVKGQEHTPTISPSGKYLIRLFWMGSWKKIYVDDTLPIDTKNRILLPTLPIPEFPTSEPKLEDTKKGQKSPKGGKKQTDEKTIELWPMLLSKALLKLASLSSYCKEEMVDFDIIQCFTGWMPQRISTRGLELGDIWEITSGYCNNFKWPNGGADTATTKTTKSQKSKSTKGGKKIAIAKLDEDTLGHPVVAICDDLTNEEIPQVSPCVSHHFLIQETRDIPLIKPPPQPDIEFWKKDRWVPWAREKGIVPPEVIPCKKYKIVSPLRRKIEEENNQQTEETIQIPLKEKPKKGKQKTESKLEPDPSVWIEHETISPHINTLIIYLAPSRFKSRTKISDVSDEKSAQTKEYWKSIVIPPELRQYRNEPLYFFSDSIDYKLLLLNISQVGDVENLNKVQIETENVSIESERSELDFCEEILRMNIRKQSLFKKASERSLNESIECPEDSRKPSIIILETYSWNMNGFGDNVAVIKTFGSKSILLELKPGRNTFRIYLDSKNCFAAQILSDTPFEVGYLEEFLTSMNNESQNLINWSMDLAGSYGKLVQSFGMPEYGDNLKNFYLTYKPSGYLSKKELQTIHRVFFEKFIELIDETFDSIEIKKAVGVLFLNFRTFNGNSRDYLEEKPHVDPDICDEDDCLFFIKSMHRAAATIQAFFKGVYVRLSLKKHQQNHKTYMLTFDRLKKVYTDIFSSSKRLGTVPNLFRSFFEDDRMENVLKKYKIVTELNDAINLQKFQGVVSLQSKTWTPICRYNFFIDSLKPVLIKISLFCDIKYYVRVFDNDTEKEIKRYSNNVAVEKYEQNLEGYTILCYGFSENDEKKNWKLSVASQKSSRNDVLITSQNNINVIILKDSYIPNEKNLICRYFVNVQNEVFLTTRLCTSYEDTDVILRILLPNGRAIAEIKGKGSVVLPIAKLTRDNHKRLSFPPTTKRRSRNSKRQLSLQSERSSTSDKNNRLSSKDSDNTPVIYTIEGYILEDSWPLNGVEWTQVELLRELKLVGSERKKSLKTIEKPCWSLQAVHEAGDVINFIRDIQKDEEMKQEKMKWYEDESRYLRSYELRRNYLSENLESRGSFEAVDQRNRSNDPDLFKPLKLKMPDFEKFLTKSLDEVDVDERVLKTLKNLEEEEENDLEKQREFEEFEMRFFEDMEDLLKEQKDNFKLWNNWFNEIRLESIVMMNGAHELKTKYISEVLDSLEKTKKGKKDEKKGKAKPKNKK